MSVTSLIVKDSGTVLFLHGSLAMILSYQSKFLVVSVSLLFLHAIWHHRIGEQDNSWENFVRRMLT